MSKRRVTFSKTGMGKYISHLDLLRCFTRAIQRSGLPVVYSQGFNPHQKMAFSLPLPIGVTSECETVDIQFEDSVTDAEIKEKLSCNLPMDMQVISVGEPVHKAAEICAALYRMEAGCDKEVCKEQIEAFFSQPEVLIAKRTKKKGEVMINLLDFVREWHITGISERAFCLNMVVDAGGERNLKPELLGNAMAEYFEDVTIDDWDICRKNVYYLADGTLKEFC